MKHEFLACKRRRVIHASFYGKSRWGEVLTRKLDEPETSIQSLRVKEKNVRQSLDEESEVIALKVDE